MRASRVSELLYRLSIAAVASITLMGCSDGEDTDKNSDAVCESLPPLELKDSYRVGFAQLWEDHGPWRDANTASMIDEADKRGYELVYDPGTKSDASEQVDRMNALIDEKVDVIFIAPHDETVLAPSVVAARRACIPTFVVELSSFSERADWDAALTDAVAAYEPDLVVLAGFMKLVGPVFLEAFGGRTVNTHPSLLPSFPGAHGPRDALAHGVKVTGATLFVVDDGLDEGPIIAQVAVPVEEGDTVDSLHERIKVAERRMLTEWVGRLAREGVPS